ncbi:MliC family protein [Marinomonas aquiplantarum]|uniref:Membrane-bound inhibitor of C-type lysozyme n=1 Tax=Marinomonas aquiplantarum TaxID=491951 RepID=A0A366CU05_9GAMM|nr:MliC family protein [Marinomonas aquiplantarum]RBO79558.1 membrane-bound inhibitor of C-type lysozyme [Marinomonas aquiplantarum]
MFCSKFTLSNGAIFGVAILLSACSSQPSGESDQAAQSNLEEVEQTNIVSYRCEKQNLQAYFHGNRAEIVWQGRSHYLTHAVSASGASYLGESLTFWAHQNEAELELEDGTHMSCQLLKVES